MTEVSPIPGSVRRNHWINQVLTQATMRPDGTAFSHRGVVTTWSETATRMDALAAALQRHGVRFGDRVLLLAPNRTEVMEAIFAINRLGAIAVPINVRLTPAEVAGLVDDADAGAIIVDESLAPIVSEVERITRRLTHVIVVGDAGADRLSYEELLSEGTGDAEFPDVPEDTPALIMYTSGTTGRPKGAMLDHLNILAQCITRIRIIRDFEDDDVCFLTTPLFHIAGISSISANFMVGVPTVIHPAGAFDPAELLDAWEREKATLVFNVPQQWQRICAEPTIRERDLRIRVATWGAAPASDELLLAMAETFPAAAIVAVFGQTELSPITCVLRGEDSLRKLGSVGKPIPTIQCRVVDEDLNDVPRGDVGEIVYRGPTLMKGYWRKPEETARAFAGGWFHSGDLVRQDDEGFVWIVDRKTDMIISGGENIYCAELENAIASHPKVLEVAIYGRADERWGEVPVAAVSLSPGQTIDLRELQGWLSGKIARFKHPKDIRVLPALPRSAVGKIDKNALRSGSV